MTPVSTQVTLESVQGQVAELEARLQREIARHRSIEEQLQASEEKYRRLVESLSEVIYAGDERGTLTYISPAVETLTEYRPDELVGRQMAEFIHPDDRNHMLRKLSQVLKGQSVVSEYRILARSGAIRWVRTSSQPIVTAGRVAGVQGVVADITEQQAIRQNILEQNQFLTDILESLAHPFYVIDANDFTIRIANSAARRAGMVESGVCYSLSHGLCGPCAASNYPCPVQEIKRTGRPVAVEHLHTTPDGGARYVEVRAYPLLDDQGNVSRIIEYTLDVTKRREAEEAYRQSEERYRKLLDAIQEGVWVIDQNGSTTFVTPTMAAMLGYEVDEMMGHDLIEFMVERDATNWNRYLEGQAQASKGQVEFHFVRKDGSRLYSQVVASPITDEQGNFLGAVVGIQDITSRKQAEVALHKSEALLKETQRLAQVGGWELDLAAEDLALTEEIYRILEWPRDLKLTLAKAISFCDPWDRPALEQAIQRAVETAESWDLELRLSTATGKSRWVRSIGKAERQNGRVTRLSGTIQDVTERRVTQDALWQAREAAEQARHEERTRRRETERRREIAEQLAQVMAALNSNEPLDRTLAYIATQARHLLDSQAVAIYRLDVANESFVPVMIHEMPDEDPPSDSTSPAYQVLRQAVTGRQPAHIAGLALDDHEAQLQAANGADGQTLESNSAESRPDVILTAVPILIKDEIFGAMLLHHIESNKLLLEEIDIATAFANQVALAIENSRLHEQTRQSAVTAERQRLARELHDSVTQNLFSASLVAEVLPQVWRKNPEEAILGLEKLRYLTRGALAEMRNLLLELRPAALLDYKLQDLLRQLIDGVTGRVDLHATSCFDPIPSMPPAVHVAFYRIAQEALQNVAKHSRASSATVCLEAPAPPDSDREAQVILRVSDNGRGFEPQSAAAAGMGLAIMSERARGIGALFTVASSPDQGTQITLVWPDKPRELSLPDRPSDLARAEE